MCGRTRRQRTARRRTISSRTARSGRRASRARAWVAIIRPFSQATRCECASSSTHSSPKLLAAAQSFARSSLLPPYTHSQRLGRAEDPRHHSDRRRPDDGAYPAVRRIPRPPRALLAERPRARPLRTALHTRSSRIVVRSLTALSPFALLPRVHSQAIGRQQDQRHCSERVRPAHEASHLVRLLLLPAPPSRPRAALFAHRALPPSRTPSARTFAEA